MKYRVKNDAGPLAAETGALREPVEAVLRGLGLTLIELTVFRHKARKRRAGVPAVVQVRVVIYNSGRADALTGVDDCSRAHHAIMPRLELAFPESDLSVEVSSPGIDRVIRDGAEAACYRGRGVRCYRTDISDWQAGTLEAADETGIVLKGTEGTMRLNYEVIAKAKLYSIGYTDSSQEV